MQPPVIAQLHYPLMPTVGAHDGLVDGKRIHELVGQNDKRPVRNVFEGRMP